MKLAAMKYRDGILKSSQVKFGGVNHNPGAGDGELYDMENLTGDLYPLLSPRGPRGRYRTLASPGGLFAWDKPAWVAGNGFFYDGARKGTVTPGEKVFAALGAYIVILPDKAYYNTENGEFGNLESRWSGSRLTFGNGSLYGEEAECNSLQAPGVDWSQYFRAGDAVTINGCALHPENNKTPIIREIDGDKLYFYEYVFTLDGDDGTEPYSESGSLSVARTVPDLRFLCENENRLWGCDGNTIYASKPGDIFNWNVFDGLASDSYAVDTGSAGEFTGCVSFLGYPVFFKEDHVYKVYGSLPSNFEVMGSAATGVKAGCHQSLAIAGETLFYLSNAGIAAYSGGIPQIVSGALGPGKFLGAAGGSDGLKYYASLQDEAGEWRLYVYDTRSGMWHIEDHTRATHFARWDGGLYFLTAQGEIWRTDTGREEPEANALTWYAEFGDFTEGDPYKKGVSKLLIRAELGTGAMLRVFIRFDSHGDWEQAGEAMETERVRSYILPIVPRRGDHYRLRLEGAGPCRVYAITREFYSGSALKSMPGRQ